MFHVIYMLETSTEKRFFYVGFWNPSPKKTTSKNSNRSQNHGKLSMAGDYSPTGRDLPLIGFNDTAINFERIHKECDDEWPQLIVSDTVGGHESLSMLMTKRDKFQCLLIGCYYLTRDIDLKMTSKEKLAQFLANLQTNICSSNSNNNNGTIDSTTQVVSQNWNVLDKTLFIENKQTGNRKLAANDDGSVTTKKATSTEEYSNDVAVRLAIFLTADSNSVDKLSFVEENKTKNVLKTEIATTVTKTEKNESDAEMKQMDVKEDEKQEVNEADLHGKLNQEFRQTIMSLGCFMDLFYSISEMNRNDGDSDIALKCIKYFSNNKNFLLTNKEVKSGLTLVDIVKQKPEDNMLRQFLLSNYFKPNEKVEAVYNNINETIMNHSGYIHQVFQNAKNILSSVCWHLTLFFVVA